MHRLSVQQIMFDTDKIVAIRFNIEANNYTQ